MEFIEIVKIGIFGGIESIFKIALIVFPIMIIMEIARDLNLLDKFSNACKPITEFIGVSKESSFPLAIGLVFGLAFGAGVIIQSAKEGNLDKKSLLIVSVFLVCCHSVIEDTLIFLAVGVNILYLLIIRIVVAFIFTFILSKRIKLKDNNLVV